MPTTTVPRPSVRLPDLPLSALPESTKDYIIAASATGKPVTEIMREALNHVAEENGFTPKRIA